MGKERGREEQVATVRAVLGEETPEMDIIRALHMAGGDPTKAVNILLDFHHKLPPPPPSLSPSPPPVKPTAESIPPPKTPAQSKPTAEKPRPNPATIGGRDHWWLVGSAEMAGLSTCKGRRIAAGEPVSFSIPNSAAAAAPGKGRPGRFALASCTSEIMRFSTPQQGEVGRIPNEWARCLLPILKEGKIKVEGLCKSAPEVLSIMDTVLLSVSVYIDSSMFRDQKQSLPKRVATEDSTFHPLPALFKVIGLSPFKKAAFTPEDLYSRKRPIERKSSTGETTTKLTSEKLKLSSGGNEDDHGEGTVSDTDLDDIIGTSDSSALAVVQQPYVLPILTLPPVNIEVKYCDLSETEKDFYEALFRRSKVKFDQFVEQGKVLHNYASILELLLRLRQCCDHPFLVMRKSMSKQDLITAPTNSRFQIDVEKNWVESSKISFLLQELESLRSSGAKSIVFSQWTAFLDLLQIPLSRHGFSFTRLDGTLTLQQREKVINEFSNDKSILVLLMSLKAGGVGINLTAASNAFVMVYFHQTIV
ncbi:hypothetical protein ACQ4PT_064685 [Festuca glaucescens]